MKPFGGLREVFEGFSCAFMKFSRVLEKSTTSQGVFLRSFKVLQCVLVDFKKGVKKFEGGLIKFRNSQRERDEGFLRNFKVCQVVTRDFRVFLEITGTFK